jgi:hypothetical protein
MSVRYIFNTSGNYVAFVQGNHIFDPRSKWLGFIEDGDDVYSANDGSYMGTLSTDDRLLVNTRVGGHNRLRPLRPLTPLRPMRPMRRLRMSRLPRGFRDYFETEAPKPAASKLLESLVGLMNSGHIPPETAADLLANIGNRSFAEILSTDTILGSQLRTPSGIFLGNVNRNKVDADSLVNRYGTYGNRFGAESIFNKYSQYGSPYGTESPYNKFSTTPPVFVKDGESLGYLTVNQYLTPRLDPDEFITWLGNG